MLHPSYPVPTLEIETLDHGHFDLARDHGTNGTLLIFYRGLHCPICIRQMTEIDAGLDPFTELGVEVLMLSADSRQAAQQTADKAGVSRLRIGHDLALKSARDDWGLHLSSAREGSQEPALFHEPGHFYVAPDGTLYAGWSQTSPFGRPALKDFKQAITFRQDRNYPPRGTYDGPVPGD